jgi:hypothetical protein
MHVPRTCLKVTLAFCAALVLAAPASASSPPSPPFTVSGLSIAQPVGAFGAIPVGSCNLVTYAGCQPKTFVLKNVGSKTIFINGFGIANAAAGNFALAAGTVGSGCEFHWALFSGSSCTIGVVASPPAPGLATNNLDIWFEDQLSPIARVPLLATGV